MKRTLLLVPVGLLVGAAVWAQESRPTAADGSAASGPVRFTWLDVYVDSGSVPLAAYQVQIRATAGRVAIVGIEGGEHAAFREPPYYDPAAMQQDRVILGAFNTGRDLPAGVARIARLHLQVTGEQIPEFSVQLDTAAASDGHKITATATVESR